MYGRWDYGAGCALTGKLPTAPIPVMDWVDGDTLRNPARKMLEACLDTIPRHGGWQYFDYFLDWLLFGFGHQGQPQLPGERRGCAGAAARLYQVFCVEALLGWPLRLFWRHPGRKPPRAQSGFLPHADAGVADDGDAAWRGARRYRVRSLLRHRPDAAGRFGLQLSNSS